MSSSVLTTLYIVGSIAFLLTQHADYPGKPLAKAAPIWLLAALAQETLPTDTVVWVTFALLFSSAGDVTLALKYKDNFIHGIAFFLTAHLLYVGALSQSLVFVTSSILPLLFIAAFAAVLTQQLYPGLGDMRIPVLVYICVIIAMGVTASLHAPFNLRLVSGALVFMLSDATIAIDKFLQPLQYVDYIVMVTYYVAQFLLVWGFMV